MNLKILRTFCSLSVFMALFLRTAQPVRYHCNTVVEGTKYPPTGTYCDGFDNNLRDHDASETSDGGMYIGQG